ncbi:unnamed protein product, partial [Diplocarpon coronariae]
MKISNLAAPLVLAIATVDARSILVSLCKEVDLKRCIPFRVKPATCSSAVDMNDLAKSLQVDFGTCNFYADQDCKGYAEEISNDTDLSKS